MRLQHVLPAVEDEPQVHEAGFGDPRPDVEQQLNEIVRLDAQGSNDEELLVVVALWPRETVRAQPGRERVRVLGRHVEEDDVIEIRLREHGVSFAAAASGSRGSRGSIRQERRGRRPSSIGASPRVLRKHARAPWEVRRWSFADARIHSRERRR